MSEDTHHSDTLNLTIAGQPITASLRDVRGLSKRMVGHFLDTVIPCGALPSDAVNGDITTITRVCLEFAVTILDGKDKPGERELARLHDAAGQWAREGIPIATILHAIHEGFRIGMRLVLAGGTEADIESLKIGSLLVIDVLDSITATVSAAYITQHRAVSSEHHTAVHTLTSALLSGRSTSTMARQCGIDIAPSYTVLALSLPAHDDESDASLNRQVVAQRKLRRLQAELARVCGGSALSLLSTDGGTVLIPSGRTSSELAELVRLLSTAAHVQVTATWVEAATTDIPDATDTMHQVLDLVRRVGREPGLYHFDDFAAEYQLTRPGPGRRALAALLTPLNEHPELVQTFGAHVANDLNRRRTARELHIHPNTLDYRLKRIAQLTGLDPAQAGGLWQLRAACIARELERSAPPSTTRPETRQTGT